MDDRQPWIFPFLVGVLLATVVCKWRTIALLWGFRREIGAVDKISEGLSDLGVAP